MNLSRWRQFDFSLGVQKATTFLMKKPNELQRGINLRFSEDVGGFERRLGYEPSGDTFATDKPAQGGRIVKFTTGSVPFVAVNNSDDTATIIRTQNMDTGAWTTLAGITYAPDSIVFFAEHLDEVYITGFDPATGDPLQPYNVDKTLDVSSTRNILHMPPCYFLQPYLGLLYAGNVKIDGTRYPDRAYKSSPPLGAVTFIQGAQTDVYAPVTLVDNVPTMTSNSAPIGTAAASTEANASNQAFMAFDDNVNLETTYHYKWTANATTGWLRYDFGSGNAKTITYYSVLGVEDPASLNVGPKTWTFEGSQDASSWTVLDTQTNVASWSASEKRTYNITNTTAYRYYRINITANQGHGTYVAISEMELLTSTEGTKSLQLQLDSVRYLKPGMAIDTYEAGTDNKLYDITILAVDKVNNTITFDPYMLAFATTDVNTTTNVITLSSTTSFPTGKTVKVDSTGTAPAGLTANTVYYAINTGSTTIKLATSLSNALLGNAIDITSQGTGTHRFKLSYVFDDNDEIWLDGRKGKLTMLWNHDYPTPENSEFLAVPPGKDSSNLISAMGTSSSRLFIWTKNTGNRWDGQNLVTFNNRVGCISQRSVTNIDDDWLIWMDQKGNVRARNESSGQQENISRAIRKNFLRKLTQDQLKAVSSGVVDNVLMIYLGTIEDRNIRVCYDFDANTWSPDQLAHHALIQDNDATSGELKPYFFAQNGKLYLDDIGNTDDGEIIPMSAGTGPDIFNDDRIKTYDAIKIFSEHAAGLELRVSVDQKQFKTIGKIDRPVCYMKFPENGANKLERGVSFDWELVGKIKGDPSRVIGTIVYHTPGEDTPNGRQ